MENLWHKDLSDCQSALGRIASLESAEHGRHRLVLDVWKQMPIASSHFISSVTTHTLALSSATSGFIDRNR